MSISLFAILLQMLLMGNTQKLLFRAFLDNEF